VEGGDPVAAQRCWGDLGLALHSTVATCDRRAMQGAGIGNDSMQGTGGGLGAGGGLDAGGYPQN